MTEEKTKVPQMTKTKQDDGTWSEEHFAEGPIGGFTFDDGRQSMIYQCGDCGQLCEFNTVYNAHKRTHNPNYVNTAFGWADPPVWHELDCKQSDILEVKK